ncbi:Uu.00g033940.m01.CDS01 [Anthostomella pinea]|uniref:Uu.00g033940.m01.CDS01 n=1 Tax=Anthostomella pinea TaxID=933095 RepID=A0AAI8V8Y6_9PEZI|nr:Uu.00g033940.m01.CDS01 [Anthostomella pinea]
MGARPFHPEWARPNTDNALLEGLSKSSALELLAGAKTVTELLGLCVDMPPEADRRRRPVAQDELKKEKPAEQRQP